MKFENTYVTGFEQAFRAMRNPMNSWSKSDSKHIWPGDINGEDNIYGCHYLIGENDMRLAQRLIVAGGEHRKFMRQIQVWVDITAPLYWWKEFDTYKVGTTANSTSTMHKLASTPITLDCFEIGDVSRDLLWDDQSDCSVERNIIPFLENLRTSFIETKDFRFWKELIRWLPESWLQTRTVSMNYENIRAMYKQRKNHKLIEWTKYFIDWAESLPYFDDLITYEKAGD